ncbi:MAG: hypothetical protein AAGD09_04500 [Cyanobacteria bacterium P01_F01_bin.56]
MNGLQSKLNNLQKELAEVKVLRQEGGGFHYAQRAHRLGKVATQYRQWYSLLRQPVWQWKIVLSETRDVLDQLAEMDVLV